MSAYLRRLPLPLLLVTISLGVSLLLFSRLMSLASQQPSQEPVAETPQHCYHIYGYLECPWFRRAGCVANEFQKATPGVTLGGKGTQLLSALIHPSRRATSAMANIAEGGEGAIPFFSASARTIVTESLQEPQAHRTSPFIYEGCGSQLSFIGGCVIASHYLVTDVLLDTTHL